MRRVARVGRRIIETICYIWDPVWGQAELQEAELKEASCIKVFIQLSTVISFVVCPCCVVGLPCSPPRVGVQFGLQEPAEARRAWCKTFFALSTLTIVAQVVLWILMLMRYPKDGTVPLLRDDITMAGFDAFGAKNAARILYEDEWWRLASGVMLHGSFMHLASNILTQLRFGFFLEYIWGHIPWALVYVQCGIYGNLLSCVLLPDLLTVGSSGALSGLFGAWIPAILFTWDKTAPKEIEMRNGQMVLAVTSGLTLVVTSYMPMVDHGAHIGGFVMGALLYMALGAGALKSTLLRFLVRATGLFGAAGLWGVTFWMFLARTAPDKRLLTYGQE